jgi:hypothetical protein
VLQVFAWFGFETDAIRFVDHDRGVLDVPELLAHLEGTELPSVSTGGVASG